MMGEGVEVELGQSGFSSSPGRGGTVLESAPSAALDNQEETKA